MNDNPSVSSSNQVDLSPGVRRSEKLIRLFLDLVPGQIDELAAAVDAGDAPLVRAHSHKLKGSCLALMAEPMARAAERLQHESEKGNLDNASDLVDELAERFMSVAALLRNELPS